MERSHLFTMGDIGKSTFTKFENPLLLNYWKNFKRYIIITSLKCIHWIYLKWFLLCVMWPMGLLFCTASVYAKELRNHCGSQGDIFTIYRFPILAQLSQWLNKEQNSSVFKWRDLLFFFQGERITKNRKYIEEPSPSSQESMGQFQPWVYGIQICSNEGPGSFPRGGNYLIAKKHWLNFKNLIKKKIINFNQTWRKASLGDRNSSLFK